MTRPHRLRTRMPLDLRSPYPRSAPGVCAPQSGGFGAASLIRRARGHPGGSSGASLPLELTKMLSLRRPAQVARLLLARVARVAADLSVRQTGAKLAAFSAQVPLLSRPLSRMRLRPASLGKAHLRQRLTRCQYHSSSNHYNARVASSFTLLTQVASGPVHRLPSLASACATHQHRHGATRCHASQATESNRRSLQAPA